MKIFIDFDDVVFNTKKFISDYKKLFQKYGVTQKIFQENYYGYPQKGKGGKLKKYNPETHIKILEKKMGIDLKNLEKEVENFVKKSKRYIFADAQKFLCKFKRKNLFLVSYGENSFQQKKIANSGVAQYFQKIIISDKLKAKEIENISKELQLEISNQDFFLDDRIEQIENVKKNYPQITTILIKRKEGRYKDRKTKYADYEAKNFLEVEKLISQPNTSKPKNEKR
jgi:FMN phosphatase YigB (HAD superfamily)